MRKKFRFVIEVEIDELSDENRLEEAKLEGCKVSDLPGVSKVEMRELGTLAADWLEGNDEIFGGTEIYCQITESKLVHSELLSQTDS